MARNQTKFIFQIGHANLNPVNGIRFDRAIAAAASVHCGGCTLSHKTGYWCEDGAEKGRKAFQAKAVSEMCVDLELTCEAGKAEAVYEAMTRSIAEAATEYAIDTNWVHVSETQITGRHFSVAAIMADRVSA